jgi:transposase
VLTEEDYQEATRRYKDKRREFHERQRYHVLILVTQGYSYQEIGRILLLDEETISRWVMLYEEKGLAGLKNNPLWGGERGRSFLRAEQMEKLKGILQEESMPGTKVGSGWTVRAIRQLVRERYGASYSKSGVRKLLSEIG